jgi:hypothetical protein
MDPSRQRLTESPRVVGEDAFFAGDRSTTPVSHTVKVVELDAVGDDRRDVAPTSVAFAGFRTRYTAGYLSEVNPLPHSRMTWDPVAKRMVIDRAVVGWTHEVFYRCYFSAAARALSRTAPDQPRLRVTLLFGTGSEGTRHGLYAAVEQAAQPTLLITVRGVEPQYEIDFTEPGTGHRKPRLRANNRWATGITVATIEKVIRQRYGRLINYSVTVCAAFSTGYLGLGACLSRRLVPLDRLERVVLFDCLYGELKQPLDYVRSVKGSVQIICYVVTGGGNSFVDPDHPSMPTLILGGNPAWHYISLLGNHYYHALSSARVVNEAVTAPEIIDTLPTTYRSALTAVVGVLPPRNTLISDRALFAKVRGAAPVGAVAFPALLADKAKERLLNAFFQQVATTRRCLTRAQLLGWPALPVGEEWHDLLLVEFGWEYLS